MRRSAAKIWPGAAAGAVLLALALPGLPAGAATNGTVRGAAPHWLVINTKAHAVTFTLIAGYTNALGGLNFNGDGNGKMVLSVPAGYRVTVIFMNKGSLPHSAVFTPYAQRNNTAAYKLAFRGSSTTNWLSGTPPGQSQRFSFVATTVGTYALVCGVPGHEAAGMWDVLKVTRGGMAHLTI